MSSLILDLCLVRCRTYGAPEIYLRELTHTFRCGLNSAAPTAL